MDFLPFLSIHKIQPPIEPIALPNRCRLFIMSEFREADQVGFTFLLLPSYSYSVTLFSIHLQTEKAYQKQDAIFIGRKRVLGQKSKKVGNIIVDDMLCLIEMWKLSRECATIRALALASRLPRVLSRELTSTRSALLLAMFPSEVEFWRPWLSPTRWREPLLCEGITCSTSPSTDVSASSTRICLSTARLASRTLERVILSPLASADLLLRLSDSTWSNTSLQWTR